MHLFSRTHSALRIGFAVLAFLIASGPVLACQVPVFRYALERWNADRYRVVVLHDKPLSERQTTALASLRQLAASRPGQHATIDLQVLDVGSGSDQQNELNPSLKQAWKNRENRSEPLMLVDYPAANRVDRTEPFLTSTLSTDTVSALADSPLRRQLTERLAKGDSAVWIFVPCGRKADDEAALQRLEKQLKADASWLKLPSPEELEVNPQVLEQVKIPLQISFSTLTLNRDDPAERVLLQSLLLSEEDLTSFDEPLAFPVFGRGRVLYALVGKGISSETIRSASSFMAGPCSCQVKNQNPGFDLLLQANWKKALGEVLISEPVETVDTEALAPTLLTIPPGRGRRK